MVRHNNILEDSPHALGLSMEDSLHDHLGHLRSSKVRRVLGSIQPRLHLPKDAAVEFQGLIRFMQLGVSKTRGEFANPPKASLRNGTRRWMVTK